MIIQNSFVELDFIVLKLPLETLVSVWDASRMLGCDPFLFRSSGWRRRPGMDVWKRREVTLWNL